MTTHYDEVRRIGAEIDALRARRAQQPTAWSAVRDEVTRLAVATASAITLVVVANFVADAHLHWITTGGNILGGVSTLLAARYARRISDKLRSIPVPH